MSSTRRLRSSKAAPVTPIADKPETSDVNSTKSKKIVKTPSQNKKRQPSELQKQIAKLKESHEHCKKLPVKYLTTLQKDMKKTYDKSKREQQLFEQERSAAKPSRNRSGRKRGSKVIHNKQNGDYSEGKWILKGMDEAREEYAADELEYLKNAVGKTKTVGDLKYEHLKYLIVYEYLDDLKAIKRGETKSYFHDRWEELKGKCQHDLQSQVKTTLFSNEQRDYISGMLQELFDANKKDEKGDIKHTQINYVVTVMLAEALIMIVRRIHNFETFEETMDYMKKSSRAAHGIADDSDEE